MNPGMLLVERQLACPISSTSWCRTACYGSTNDLTIRSAISSTMPRWREAAGVERVYAFSTIEGLGQGLTK